MYDASASGATEHPSCVVSEETPRLPLAIPGRQANDAMAGFLACLSLRWAAFPEHTLQ